VLGPSCGSKKGRGQAREASPAAIKLPGVRRGGDGVAALLGSALLVLPLVVGRWLGMRSGVVVVEGGRGEIAASAVGAADAAGVALTRASAASV